MPRDDMAVYNRGYVDHTVPGKWSLSGIDVAARLKGDAICMTAERSRKQYPDNVLSDEYTICADPVKSNRSDCQRHIFMIVVSPVRI